MNKQVISLKNINKTYGGDLVLDDLSLDVFQGEFLTLLGPSGCGKTTILRVIAGLEECDTGEIYIDNILNNKIPANLRDVNTVFQNYALFPHMSVFSNVAFGLKLKKLPKSLIKEKVTSVLKLVKLSGFESRNVNRLSGGQKQRVAIARAIVNEPLILLLDEPLSALDFKLRKQMQLELKQLHRKLGITFIFVTHDQEEALAMSDRVVVMNEGKIEQTGTPIEIYETPENMFVAKFVGEINVFDGSVLSENQGKIEVGFEGISIECENDKDFKVNDNVKFLLRPEDMRVFPLSPEYEAPYLTGKVDELIYKGTTVDLIITLESGKEIYITEFFNEDAEEISYETGEKVCVNWYDGWEVILSDEN